MPAGFQLISKIMGTQQLLLFSFHQCSSRFIPICAFFTIFVLPSNMHDYLTFFSKLTLCIMFNFFLSSIHEIMNLMCLLYDMYVILTILLCVYAQSLSCADTFLFFFFLSFFLSDSFQPMDCSLTGSSVHGILQARMLEWVSISSSSRSSDPGIEPMSFLQMFHHCSI